MRSRRFAGSWLSTSRLRRRSSNVRVNMTLSSFCRVRVTQTCRQAATTTRAPSAMRRCSSSQSASRWRRSSAAQSRACCETVTDRAPASSPCDERERRAKTRDDLKLTEQLDGPRYCRRARQQNRSARALCDGDDVVVRDRRDRTCLHQRQHALRASRLVVLQHVRLVGNDDAKLSRSARGDQLDSASQRSDNASQLELGVDAVNDVIADDDDALVDRARGVKHNACVECVSERCRLATDAATDLRLRQRRQPAFARFGPRDALRNAALAITDVIARAHTRARRHTNDDGQMMSNCRRGMGSGVIVDGARVDSNRPIVAIKGGDGERLHCLA